MNYGSWRLATRTRTSEPAAAELRCTVQMPLHLSASGPGAGLFLRRIADHTPRQLATGTTRPRATALGAAQHYAGKAAATHGADTIT